MAEAASYISIDTISEFATERKFVREEAWRLVAEREEQLALDSTYEVPLALDALSTADSVLSARYQYGQGSPEYADKLAGLELDCLRLVAEWYRKKRPEYFPTTRHVFDKETGEFYSHGLSIRQMTENALRPIDGSPEEVARRVNERVEDETPRILRGLGSSALAGVGVRTISECTDKAIQEYEEDAESGSLHRGYDGYVPEIQKLMIRDMRIDAATGDRLQEQIALPGVYITHDVIQRTLENRGVAAMQMDKTELHGTQLLVEDDLMDFARALDDTASREWCTNVFMGEEVPKGYIKNYEDFREEALVRQVGLTGTAETVASFVLELAGDSFDRRKAPAHVENFVKKLLLDLAQKDIKQGSTGLAEQIFDERTADKLQEVIYLERAGRHEEAYDVMQEVEKLAPGGGYCSGGSCGLESVNKFSKEGESLMDKLKADPGDTIVKDKERKCRCGSKSIVYAYSKSKVNKYCENCHAFEGKKTK